MGRFVTGLTRDNFKLFEDGVEQQISQLSSEDVPISVGIAVDVSGSIGAKMEAERAAVSQFLKTARPNDEFFLMPFNDEPLLTVAFTHDTEAIQNGLRNARTRGGTSLRDAVFLAIHEMKKARNARRAILIVSDGTDNTSTHSASEMTAALQEADLQLYAISLADRPDRRGFAGIREAVDQPGGLDAGMDNVTAAPTRAARIAVSLRNLYVLSYTASNTIRDGKLRRVQVQIVQPVGLPPLKVTYRAGYYAQ
jgi:VWFA-related protein